MLRIWLYDGFLGVAEIEVKGVAENVLRGVLADSKVQSVTLGPTSNRLYFYGKEGRELGHSDEGFKIVNHKEEEYE